MGVQEDILGIGHEFDQDCDAYFEEQRRFWLFMIHVILLSTQASWLVDRWWRGLPVPYHVYVNLIAVLSNEGISRFLGPSIITSVGAVLVQVGYCSLAFQEGFGPLLQICFYVLPVIAALTVGPKAALVFGFSFAAQYVVLGLLAGRDVIPMGTVDPVLIGIANGFGCIFVGVMLSIYEWRRQSTHRKLVELLRHKERFLSEISHEVRSPLVGIMSSAELLCKERTGASSELPSIILESSTQLLSVVNQVLEMAALLEGERAGTAVVVKQEAFEVESDVVEPAYRMFKALAASKGIAFSMRVDRGLPAVRGDRKKLAQALGNVVGNALKFTRTRVVISATMNPELRISVSDDGKGMSEEELERIFHPFERLSRQEPGTGLGLSICRSIMERMGGAVVVESERGKGSTFTLEVSLPVAEGEDEDAAWEDERDEVVEFELDNPLVVVVDDNAINRVVLAKQLKSLGCRAVVLGSEGELDAWLDETKEEPDAVFMDLNLEGGVRGIDVAARLRQRWEGPVVAHSASVSKAERARCARAGIELFLPKPSSLGQIKQVLIEAKDY